MARDVVDQIRRATRRKFRAEDKIRIDLEDMVSRLTTGKPVSAGRSRGVKIPGPPKGPLAWQLPLPGIIFGPISQSLPGRNSSGRSPSPDLRR
jgi:hypothetical protein